MIRYDWKADREIRDLLPATTHDFDLRPPSRLELRLIPYTLQDFSASLEACERELPIARSLEGAAYKRWQRLKQRHASRLQQNEAYEGWLEAAAKARDLPRKIALYKVWIRALKIRQAETPREEYEGGCGV